MDIMMSGKKHGEILYLRDSDMCWRMVRMIGRKDPLLPAIR